MARSSGCHGNMPSWWGHCAHCVCRQAFHSTASDWAHRMNSEYSAAWSHLARSADSSFHYEQPRQGHLRSLLIQCWQQCVPLWWRLHRRHGSKNFDETPTSGGWQIAHWTHTPNGRDLWPSTSVGWQEWRCRFAMSLRRSPIQNSAAVETAVINDDGLGVILVHHISCGYIMFAFILMWVI